MESPHIKVDLLTNILSFNKPPTFGTAWESICVEVKKSPYR